jgi:hypothetical protein
MFTNKQQLNTQYPRARHACLLFAVAGLTFIAPASVRADVVTEWNQNAQEAIRVANAGLVAPRFLAIVQAAVFDAVNGIERRYTPYHVDFNAPRGASRRAAAIQAAYATLVSLFPSQKTTLDAHRDASLASITDDGEFDDSESIARGIAWGQLVADDILAWRSADGFNVVLPPFTGGSAPGQWRPTPPAFSPANRPQMANMIPFAIEAPSQFRPAGPPALASEQYALDFNEVKAIGRVSGSTRTAEQTEIARFWADSAAVHWNRIALTVGANRNATMSENARQLALLNIAMADALIACWDSKFTYNFWRPVTAIPLAGTDGNDATSPDGAWAPLLGTPAFPEYVSAHSSISSAAARVLAAGFGDGTMFTHSSDALPGVIRTHASFSAAVREASDSRIYGGIHFRSATNDGQAMGDTIGAYVTENLMQSVHGRRDGQINHNHGFIQVGADYEIGDGSE